MPGWVWPGQKIRLVQARPGSQAGFWPSKHIKLVLAWPGCQAGSGQARTAHQAFLAWPAHQAGSTTAPYLSQESKPNWVWPGQHAKLVLAWSACQAGSGQASTPNWSGQARMLDWVLARPETPGLVLARPERHTGLNFWPCQGGYQPVNSCRTIKFFKNPLTKSSQKQENDK